MRSIKTGFYVICVALCLLSGCQSYGTVKPDQNYNETNAALIYVYRPSSQWMGLAIDFRASANTVDLGSLDTGGYVKAFVLPKQTTVRVQSFFLGIPDGRPGELELDLKQGETYYIRFNQAIDRVVQTSNNAVPIGSMTLSLVTESEFKSQK